MGGELEVGAAISETVGAPLPQPRPPSLLMRPERLGALQPGPLSASRTLLAQMIAGRWRVERLAFDLDGKGRGRAHYRVVAGSAVFDFPVFSFEPQLAGRTGRIVGRKWDMMAALIEGPVTAQEIEETARAMPRLYGGRAAPRTLNWCRANRSSRVFEHAAERLAAGAQPEPALLAQACYVMRNTGIEGNGTIGTRTFLALEDDHELRRPLAAQMLCGYLMRCFAVDLLHHTARLRNPSAAELAPDWQRFIGLGNGSALGLVLYAYNHPKLIDRWLQAYETALVAAQSLPRARALAALPLLLRLLDRAIRFREQDRMQYDALAPSPAIAGELSMLRARAAALPQRKDALPLAELCAVAAGCHPETQETLHVLLQELVPDVIAELRDGLIVEEEMTTEPLMRVGALRDLLHAEYGWALAMRTDDPARRYVWYKSAAAEEPRRGPREEAGDAHDLAVDLPLLMQRLEVALEEADLGSKRRPLPAGAPGAAGDRCARAGAARASLPLSAGGHHGRGIRADPPGSACQCRDSRHRQDARLPRPQPARGDVPWCADAGGNRCGRRPVLVLPAGAAGVNAMTPPADDAFGADEALTGPIVISLREARLVVERILLLAPVPPGLVPDVRESVLVSQMLGLGGFSLLLDSYAELSAGAAPSLEGESLHCHGAHAWLVAPAVADLAVEAAFAGGGTFRVSDVRAPAELATATGLAARHGAQVQLGAAGEIIALPAAGAPPASRLDALAWRMVCDGFPVLGSLWWRLYHLSNGALTPDSLVSRRHAGHIVVHADGSITGRRDIDDDTDLRLLSRS